MVEAWVVRPKPHGYNRISEFKNQEIVAIGWPRYGDLSEFDKSEIRDLIEESHDWSAHKVGQTVGQINRFINKFEQGDFVVVPSGGNVYIGRIETDYYFDNAVAGDDEGYPHQREVDWLFGGNAVDRSSLPGRLHDSLKGRLTVFSLDAELVSEVERSRVDLREGDRYAELQDEYLNQLQNGELFGINSASFEDAAQVVLDKYFPNLTRQSTRSDPEGDTDLRTDLPGGITVRVQVKHYYSEQGELPVNAVTQLQKSMEPGDNGIVLTSTAVSEEALDAARESEYQLDAIGGSGFVELVFENLDEFSAEELHTLGLREQPPEIQR